MSSKKLTNNGPIKVKLDDNGLEKANIFTNKGTLLTFKGRERAV